MAGLVLCAWLHVFKLYSEPLTFINYIMNLLQWKQLHSTRISQFLKHRSPTTSEYKPLNGLDPTTHAEVCVIALLYMLKKEISFAYILTSVGYL